MEDKYRQHIIKNLEKLIRLTDYENLMKRCVSSELLTAVMRNNVENWDHNELVGDKLQHERHKRLFIKLTKRGPKAYQQIKNILSELKYDEALTLLNEPCNNDTEFRSLNHSIYKNANNREKFRLPLSNNGVDEGDRQHGLSPSMNDNTDEKQHKLELYTKKILPKEVHQVHKSKFVKIHPQIGVYPMRSRSDRGVFFMVNIIDFPDPDDRRNGAEEDGESLLHLFKELGFKLFAYVNLTQSEFVELLDEIIDSEYTRNAECFVMALMTHGSMDHSVERVQFHDGSVRKVRDIEDRFSNQCCPNLLHKPKIFIFPFCRGEIADRGHKPKVQTDSIRDTEPIVNASAVPTFSDVFICYASMRGFKSHRDSLDGSWYIQKFCKIMALHAHDLDFEDIVKLIQFETGQLRTGDGAMQTGSYMNMGFNRKLYFNPGAYED